MPQFNISTEAKQLHDSFSALKLEKGGIKVILAI